jgi:hypothetical protein
MVSITPFTLSLMLAFPLTVAGESMAAIAVRPLVVLVRRPLLGRRRAGLRRPPFWRVAISVSVAIAFSVAGVPVSSPPVSVSVSVPVAIVT